MNLTEFMGLLGRAWLYLAIVPICVTAIFIYIYYDDKIYYNADLGIELLTDDGALVSFLKQEVAPSCSVQIIDSKKRASIKTRATSKESVLNSMACSRNKIDAWVDASKPFPEIDAGGENEKARKAVILTQVFEKIEYYKEVMNMSEQEYNLTLEAIKSSINALISQKTKTIKSEKSYKYETSEKNLTIREERPKWWNVIILSYIGSFLTVLGIALVGHELRHQTQNVGEKYTFRGVLKAMWVKWNV